MQHHGDLEAAESTYETLLPDAPTDDKRRWLLFNLGAVALERGDIAAARARFERVYTEDERDEYGAKARYEVAQLATDPRAAVEGRLDVIRRYPEQVTADFALSDIVRELKANEQRSELAALLEQLTRDVAGTEVCDNVWFELAMLRREAGDPDGALAALRELYARHAKGPLADDALWEMSEIYRAHQMWEPAISLMTRIALDVETSWFVGSYDSDWVDNATYDIGWVHLVFRSDYEGAEKWFRRYLRKFPDGIQADDAAWNLVQIRRLRGDDDGYREAMRAFVQDFPDSRFVRRATAQLGDT